MIYDIKVQLKPQLQKLKAKNATLGKKTEKETQFSFRNENQIKKTQRQQIIDLSLR